MAVVRTKAALCGFFIAGGNMRYFEIDIDEDQFRRFIKAVIDQYERAELVETTETMH